MQIIFRIWVGLICMCCCVIAQTKYHPPHYVSQEVQYDDDEPSYNRHQNKQYEVKRHPTESDENNDEYSKPLYGKLTDSLYKHVNHPQSGLPYSYYEPKREEYRKDEEYKPKYANYNKPKDTHGPQEDPYRKHGYPKYVTIPYDNQRVRTVHSEQPEELQYSHEPEHASYHQEKPPQSSHPQHISQPVRVTYDQHESPQYTSSHYNHGPERTTHVGYKSPQSVHSQHNHEPGRSTHDLVESPRPVLSGYSREPERSTHDHYDSPQSVHSQNNHELVRSTHDRYESPRPVHSGYSREPERPTHDHYESPQSVHSQHNHELGRSTHDRYESPQPVRSQYHHEPEPSTDDHNKSPQPVYSQYSREPEHSSYEQPESLKSTNPSPPSSQRDNKLPLYFTMYEKRIIQDPTDKYGKGPWRYLTYGHGITYGSKEPGKVFERGYGYIRALGRDHCKDRDNLCPQRDEKPFEYEGRKEPYFGYRPH